MPTPFAVIFDRDGVLNEDYGYAFEPEKLVWIPGARAAIKRVNDAGGLVLIATNQSGIGRGYYSEEQMHGFHAEMRRQLAAEGARIDEIYFCPFHEDAAEDRYRQADHPDRKPNPGMVLRALRDFGIDPKNALMIGDKPADVQAANGAGVDGYLFAGGDLDAFLVACAARTGLPL
ncbi:HAD-IIIA family hydrolase [Caulobacter sp. SLTY]|uniref:D-glycero-alpha-D-manno-heptose-1,7-bisphosphate 7-phosphatase n=1 Tax=Caulobacter sp. SLTY TaxID=2683262 RepID=UPI0014136AE7|nr:HAD family hydrolase [Caulobacter sp. SLTY]NBB13871.1 HAD-IIIA family hydrolase [Caulobacter sp. SLTY]